MAQESLIGQTALKTVLQELKDIQPTKADEEAIRNIVDNYGK